MLNVNKRKSIFIISLISSAIVWCGESLIHFTILEDSQSFELIPRDLNELWMRLIICGQIIVFGAFAQKYANKKIDVAAEKMRTLNATMDTVQDRVGNALAGIKLLLSDSNNLSEKEKHQKLITLIDEVFSNLRSISDLEEVNEKIFHGEIYHLKINK